MAGGVLDGAVVGQVAVQDESIDLNVGDEAHAWGLDSITEDLQVLHTELGDNTRLPVDDCGRGLLYDPKKMKRSWRKPMDKARSNLQPYPDGPFDRSDLHWNVKHNNGKGNVRETRTAVIPWDRLPDFLDGEETNREFPCTFLEVPHQPLAKQNRQQVREDSALKEISYWCEYGPKDMSNGVQKDLGKIFAHVLQEKKKSSTQREVIRKAKIVAAQASKNAAKKQSSSEPLLEAEGDDLKDLEDIEEEVPPEIPHAPTFEKRKTRVGKVQAGMSMKKGCQCNFKAKQLLVDPTLYQIQFHCMTHTNQLGQVCHGAQFGGIRHALAGRLSWSTRAWIENTLRTGLSPAQVLALHKREVMELAKQNKKATRDTFILPHDVYNIAKKLAKELWERHPIDAKSVQMWVEENPDCHYYYNESGDFELNDELVGDFSFCLAIQTEWQLDMMVRYGHCKAVSMDSTFGTNVPKYPLYTVMVFDEWEQGILVAFTIIGKSKEGDIYTWLNLLNARCIARQDDWKPNAIIVDCAQAEINAIGRVWPQSKIMLCLWHVRKAWMENATRKIKTKYLRVLVLKATADLMYGSGLRQGEAAVKEAKDKFNDLKVKYPAAKEFMAYFEKQWLGKIQMWIKAYRNMPHANQDTNAAVESYHSNLKSILATSRQRFEGRKVDWLVYHLVGDVINHYWYAVQCKIYGFVKNGKAKGVVANAVLRAREIPDDHVLISPECALAVVASQTNYPHVWTVTHPDSDWAQCNCPVGMGGNVCKHTVKVFKLLNNDIDNANIIRYAGTLRGTIAGGYDTCGIDAFQSSRLVQDTEDDKSQCRSVPDKIVDVDNPEKLLRSIKGVLEELELFVRENPLLRGHVLSTLYNAKGKVLDLQAKSNQGLLHPLSQPTFHIGSGDKKTRRTKSFWESKSTKGRSKKRP